MKIKYILFIIFLFSFPTHSRDMTKPPSIGLRTEVSYLSVVTLVNKEKDNTEITQLKFNLIKNIHNKSKAEVVIDVLPELARKLSVKTDYIIAYYKLKKTRVGELKKYIPLLNGPQLLSIEGANPAIFRYNPLLIEHFFLSPSLAKSDPQVLIQSIFKGLLSDDSKIQEFFVREIINWTTLHQHLKSVHFEQLYSAFISPNGSVGTRVAILEGRSKLHKAIGIERLGQKVIEILYGTPVNLDMDSESPTLILQGLKFLDENKLGNWDNISRWAKTNVPTLSERSLLMLAKIDSKKSLELAKNRLLDTFIDEPSRRVNIRVIQSNKTQ
jgi:hypothetical protein